MALSAQPRAHVFSVNLFSYFQCSAPMERWTTHASSYEKYNATALKRSRFLMLALRFLFVGLLRSRRTTFRRGMHQSALSAAP